MEKLCPHCEKWSDWNGHIDDKCSNCGEFLKLTERTEIADKEARLKKLQFDLEKKFPFKVKDGDNLLVKAIKRTAYGIYYVFMSIMLGLLWIIFWLAS